MLAISKTLHLFPPVGIYPMEPNETCPAVPWYGRHRVREVESMRELLSL